MEDATTVAGQDELVMDVPQEGPPATAETWKRALDYVVPCCVVLK